MRSLLKRALAKAGRMTLVDVAHLHALHETMHLGRLFDLLGVDLVIDIGANAGQYATRLRHEVGYRGAIVSVEPIPEMIEYINRARQNDPDWYLEPLAISDRNGTVTFNVMNDLQCSSLVMPDNSETSLFARQTTVERQITVRSESLDALMSKWLDGGRFKRPFLKLDTQGHDVTIVKGCRRMREFVAFQSELSVKRLYQGTPAFAEAIVEYCALGYDISALVPNNAAGFPQLIETDCIMIRRDMVVGGGQIGG